MIQTMKIKSDGSIQDAKPIDKKKFTLQELQEAVNGLAEIIELSIHQCYMIVNEERKILELPVNKRASIFYEDEYGLPNAIAGDVLICNKDQVD